MNLPVNIHTEQGTYSVLRHKLPFPLRHQRESKQVGQDKCVSCPVSYCCVVQVFLILSNLVSSPLGLMSFRVWWPLTVDCNLSESVILPETILKHLLQLGRIIISEKCHAKYDEKVITNRPFKILFSQI